MSDIEASFMDEDAVLKEVWNTENIEAKTELNSIQIEAVNKALTLAEILDSHVLSKHINKFMCLQKSKDRKSMSEFVSVVKAKREDFVQKGQGFFKGMMG